VPTVNAGESIGFTVTVTNVGPGVATGVTINDPLPAGGRVWCRGRRAHAPRCEWR
jgi:uncharacterized repeat protein (TIGR01451 family)